ncbi:MAG: hypothetical protein Q6362_004040 [Candidatus Wukongarchaeota archaeon]|nr:hypothetical protein [Candidatus Wukongarchaeota archaeon]MDO8128600.1 hypothetical protein [Candidatus Wukongarchaeota archaeon]
MERSQWILLGALIFGLSSIACGFDMLNRAEEGESYTVNQYFHPITGIIFVLLLSIYFYPFVQERFDIENMETRTWLLSGFGALIFGLGSIGCAFDMLDRAEEGESYTVNLFFHPITGIIFVVLLLIFFYPLLQKLMTKK